jgi:5-methylcytosine-specific restriction endonuclease McrA
VSDSRRFFNKSERAALFLAADGKCSNPECGRELEPGWHSDHIQPHSKFGKTDVFNGQALCPDCNVRKGNKEDV